MSGGAGFAASVGVAWLDLTGFEQYIWFYVVVAVGATAAVHVIDCPRDRLPT